MEREKVPGWVRTGGACERRKWRREIFGKKIMAEKRERQRIGDTPFIQIAQAKTLLMQDPNFKKGFKFDHVWDMLKDFEKFSDVDFGITKPRKHGSTYVSSESEAPIPDSPLMSSPNLPSFSLNLNKDVAGEATSSQRPIGVKKAKLKRKIDEDYVKMIQSENSRLVEAMEKSSNSRNEASRQNEFKEENKILLTKLNSIDDPNLREFLRQEQKQIIDKRSQQFQQPQAQ
uniref:No apical meristem-associated C-terminal domain-containing protein n=1 Tax=Nicotiana tabacum TaxID=4097 RepID=A0A1S4BM21_TOBAC|nr:PREDICTED: uncharacterized protein LOC107809735 [Nicotiana tabacum]